MFGECEPRGMKSHCYSGRRVRRRDNLDVRCPDKLSVWSYFAPLVLRWLLVNTTSLPAGEDLNTGKGALDHDRICGQCVPNDTRLTMSSQPVSAVHSSLGKTNLTALRCSNGSTHCWSRISGSPPRPPPCRFSRMLIASPFIVTTQGLPLN